MNLTTHWVLALALGIGIFHNVEIALMMSVGALIPDLDREYLFVAKTFIGKYQLHRSLFHNFFFIGLLYFVNPFLCLGALSHSLLDMFTSATDRGAEVWFPITRLVKKYYYKIDGTKDTLGKTAEWWVEDPWRLLKDTSDVDLQEPNQQPWTRSYGPFKNSRIVDWGIFFSSLAFLGISYLFSKAIFYSMATIKPLSLISLAGIAVFYGLGEEWRRKMANAPATKKEDTIVLAILLLGLAVFLVGGYYLFLPPRIIPNANFVLYALIPIAIGLPVSYVFVRQRKKYEDLAL